MTGNILPVILSGGSGSRLWPLSRAERPKQFLNLTDENSLFQQTVKRISRFQNPIIVGNEDHRFLIAEQLRQSDVEVASLILEPTPKDTAPAVALAALEAISTGHKDDILLVLPADQIIEDESACMESIEAGLSLVNNGYMVMFGSTPSAPKSNYGYIEMGSDIDGYGHVITSFNEKPDLQRAEEFCEAGNFLWSTGIFMFTPSQYMDALEAYDPEIARRCRVAHVERRVDTDFVRPGKDAFESSPECSLTYTLLDTIDKMAVVPLMTPWNDVGSWSDLWSVLHKDEAGNHIQGNVMAEDIKNSLIHSESGMLAVMGLEDIVVVQTADATLVADKKKANLAKKVFERLRDRDNSKHASHQQVYMSWGYTTLMQEAENRQSKTVTVNPECTTDEQKYNKRITHWIITKGEGLVSVDGKNTNIKAGESVCLTAGTVYTIKNTTTSSLEIIEISLGDMNEETVIQKEGIEEQMNASVLSASMEKIVPLNN